MKLLQSNKIYKQKISCSVLPLKFLHEIFSTPNSKNIIVTLCIVTIEKAESKFLLILNFYADNYICKKAAM